MEFYSNIWVEKDDSVDYMLKSYMNEVEMLVVEELLAKLFHLNDSGRKIQYVRA